MLPELDHGEVGHPAHFFMRFPAHVLIGAGNPPPWFITINCGMSKQTHHVGRISCLKRRIMSDAKMRNQSGTGEMSSFGVISHSFLSFQGFILLCSLSLPLRLLIKKILLIHGFDSGMIFDFGEKLDNV